MMPTLLCFFCFCLGMWVGKNTEREQLGVEQEDCVATIEEKQEVNAGYYKEYRWKNGKE